MKIKFIGKHPRKGEMIITENSVGKHFIDQKLAVEVEMTEEEKQKKFGKRKQKMMQLQKEKQSNMDAEKINTDEKDLGEPLKEPKLTDAELKQMQVKKNSKLKDKKIVKK